MSFERVLVQWEARNFDQIRLAEAQPLRGLSVVIKRPRTRGEAKQKELVGLMAVAESGIVNVSSFLADNRSNQGSSELLNLVIKNSFKGNLIHDLI